MEYNVRSINLAYDPEYGPSVQLMEYVTQNGLKADVQPRFYAGKILLLALPCPKGGEGSQAGARQKV